MRTYYLDVKRKGSNIPNYTLEESLRDKNKRRVVMMGYTIEELDKKTGLFASFKELSEELNEVHNSDQEMNDPYIIVDEDDNDLSKSYVIYDIVYEDDKKVIDNPDYIKSWLLEYLKKNPDDIYRIKGIRNIFQNKYNEEFTKGIINERTIEQIVYGYLENPSYKKYRDIYFTLKTLDRTREKNNEIHR